MQHQTHMFRGQPDDEAIKLLRYYAGYALELDPRGYCVCTSEGKDSRVLGHLMRRAKVPHFYLHNITGIDPPELIKFQRQNFQQYRDEGYLTYDVMYGKSLWQMMRENLMPPLRQARYCCKHMKERRVIEQGNALLALGVRAGESANRARNRAELEANKGKNRKASVKMAFDNDDDRRSFETCYRDHEQRINPMLQWSDDDIWAYSKDVGLEQCILYACGFHRLGCIGCPMARERGRRREFEYWPGFLKPYMVTFNWMFAELERRGRVMFSNDIKSGADWFEWWLKDSTQEKPLDGQLGMKLHEEDA